LTRLPDDAVQQQAAFVQLQKPNPRDLRFLSDWLRRPDLGAVYLIGKDSDIWNEPDRLDLAVLKARRNESIFTALLSDKFIHSLHQKLYWVVSSTVYNDTSFQVLIVIEIAIYGGERSQRPGIETPGCCSDDHRYNIPFTDDNPQDSQSVLDDSGIIATSHLNCRFVLRAQHGQKIRHHWGLYRSIFNRTRPGNERSTCGCFRGFCGVSISVLKELKALKANIA
jgi:hypothetical protein